MYQRPVLATTGKNSKKAGTVAPFDISAANNALLGTTIRNTSGGLLYIGLGFDPSATDHTMAIADGGYYEVPFNFVGSVRGVCVTPGPVQVTELS